MPIKELPVKYRPREKAINQGLDKLTEIELLALFIRTGNKADVLSVSANILKKFKSLRNIKHATLKELMSISGIGLIKALEIKALFEFARRLKIEESLVKSIDSDKDAFCIIRSLLINHLKEHFIVIFLDKRNKTLSVKNLYMGSSSEVSISPKEIISEALKLDANAIYCFHNHPSGVLKPSKNDCIITKKIKYLCLLFEIQFRGHFIFNNENKFKKINYLI